MTRDIGMRRGFLAFFVGLTVSPVFADFAISSATNDQTFPAIAWSGSKHLVVWDDKRSGNQDIYGQIADNMGNLVGSNFVISDAANNQRYPAVAWDGTNYLVVWEDTRGSDYDIYGQRVDTGGNLVGSNFTISTAANDQRYVAVAWDGTNYMVVWGDLRQGAEQGIYGQRVDAGGNLVGQNFVVSAETRNQCAPSIAWSGTNHLVVWYDDREAIANYDIYAQTLDANGNLVSSNFVVSEAVNIQQWPAVVWGGTNYVAVWQDKRTGDLDIYGQILGPTGSLVGQNFEISTAAEKQSYPALTYDGANCLAVWSDNRSGNYDIYGQGIRPEGGLIESDFGVTGDGNRQWYPAAACDGSKYYLVAWQDNRNGNYDIYGYLVPLVGIEERDGSLSSLRVSRPTPSPFRDWVKIRYDVSGSAIVPVVLSIYDGTGRFVKTLVDTKRGPGSYSESWDGTNACGELMPGGIYFYSLEVGSELLSRKMIRIE